MLRAPGGGAPESRSHNFTNSPLACSSRSLPTKLISSSHLVRVRVGVGATFRANYGSGKGEISSLHRGCSDCSTTRLRLISPPHVILAYGSAKPLLTPSEAPMSAAAQIALFERKTERILRTLQAEAAPLVTRPYPA